MAEGRLTQAEEMVASPIPENAAVLGFDEWWKGATFDERRRVLDGAVDKVMVLGLSHDIAQPYRDPGVKVGPTRSPMTGVPKNRWSDVTRARLHLIYRAEVVPQPTKASRSSRRRPGVPS